MNILALILLICLSIGQISCSAYEEEVVAEYLKEIDRDITRHANRLQETAWAHDTNITSETDRKKKEVTGSFAKYLKWLAQSFQKFNWRSYQSDDLRRQLNSLSKFDQSVLPEADFAAYLNATSVMKSNFDLVRLCHFEDRNNCDIPLEPRIEQIFSTSRNPEELTHYWREFYDKLGTSARVHFEKCVSLRNKAATLNNFTSGAEYWLSKYEDDTIEQQMENVLDEIRPLYLQIHGYVRHRLIQRYGESVISRTGPIPMHILGDVWAERWSGIGDMVSPFPGKMYNITNEMLKQGYTPLKMFQLGDDFFTSMNLTKLPQTFWEKSIIEKPNDGRDIVCHPSSWDFSHKDDARIKMCTRVTQDHFFTVHHELGHIQYILQYQHLPYAYRNGANPGFHEAVGDVLSLSVSTPKHLQRIGLLGNETFDKEARINRLFLTALEKIVFLPFAYTVEKYRWSLFRGQVPKNKWNCAFWKLREEYSGIEPPVKRSENDFDPPAKYHISADIEYLRYFFAFVLEFQFYKSACIKAGQYDPQNPELPLDNCDIYGSFEVGKSFHDMLSLGSSKPWPDALEAFNGERSMNASAIVEYFEPLRVWLEAENIKNNVHIGWTSSDKCSSV